MSLYHFFLKKSGIMGPPLILLSIITTTFIIERIFFYTKLLLKKGKNSIESKIPLLEQRTNLKNDSDNSTLFYSLIKDSFSGYNLLSYEKISYLLQKEWEKSNLFMKFFEYTIAVAPLLGILGTITGIISSFHALGEFNSQKRALVTNGIAEALLTTAAGLIIAITTLSFYYLFKWCQKLIFSPYEHFLSFFKTITEEKSE